jgi:hypothetical protein
MAKRWILLVGRALPGLWGSPEPATWLVSLLVLAAVGRIKLKLVGLLLPNLVPVGVTALLELIKFSLELMLSLRFGLVTMLAERFTCVPVPNVVLGLKPKRFSLDVFLGGSVVDILFGASLLVTDTFFGVLETSCLTQTGCFVGGLLAMELLELRRLLMEFVLSTALRPNVLAFSVWLGVLDNWRTSLGLSSLTEAVLPRD